MSFTPSRWLPGPHWMTVYGSVARFPRRAGFRRERWELPDGDFVDVDRLDGARPDAPLVVICHGLEGSSRSGYVVGLAGQLSSLGLAVAALNFRGCSGEPNRLPRFYHSGETGDLREVIKRLVSQQPGRALGLAGFSLGGNVTVKYLAEGGLPDELRAAAVVSVPFDLELCCRAIDGPGLVTRIYRNRFLRRLRPKALAKAARFPHEIDARAVESAQLLREFDEAVTAPLHGFADALDYYRRSSSGPLVGQVARPLHILSAEDDPMVPPASIPVERAKMNPHVTLEVHARGGHVGFVSGPPWNPRRYAERRVAEVLAKGLL